MDDHGKDTAERGPQEGNSKVNTLKDLFGLANDAISVAAKVAIPVGVFFGALIASRYLVATGNEWAISGLLGNWKGLLAIAAFTAVTATIFIASFYLPILVDYGLNMPDSEGWRTAVQGNDAQTRCDCICRMVVVCPLALLPGLYVMTEYDALLWILPLISLGFAAIDICRIRFQGRLVQQRKRQKPGQTEVPASKVSEFDEKKPTFGTRLQFTLTYLLRILFLTFPLLVFVLVFNDIFGTLPAGFQWLAFLLMPVLISIPYAVADLRGYLPASLVILGLALTLLSLAPFGAASETIFKKWANAGETVEIECVSERCAIFTGSPGNTLERVLSVAGRTAFGIKNDSGRPGIWLDDTEFVICNVIDDDKKEAPKAEAGSCPDERSAGEASGCSSTRDHKD